MRDEHRWTTFFEYLVHRLGIDKSIIRRRIWCHLPKELIDRFFILRKLAFLIEIGPEPHTELPKPKSFIGRCIDFPGDNRTPRSASTWLIDNINGVLFTKEKRFKAFSPIGRRIPCL